MAGLASRALILSASRFANYGLMLIGPIILVRLLSVEDFGRYREFLLYASILQTIAGFGISAGLLYFIPSYRENTWRIVRVTVLLTFLSSVAVVGVVVVADLLTQGAIIGAYLVPLAIYVLLFVNLDFWEYLWLSNNRPIAVMAYSMSRLATRLILVIGVTAFTRDVEKVIWALCILEAVRVTLSAVAWRILDRGKLESRVQGIWREQLKFCLPAGFAAAIHMASRNLGNVAVAKVLGASALAQYSIGLFGEPILLALRNSISAVLLPEMISRKVSQGEDPLQLWRRALVVNCVLLFPVAAVLMRYAEPIVVTVFGAAFAGAAPVLQVYALAIVRECLDFSPPLRALNNTRPLAYSNAIALAVNVGCLWFLLPRAGILGAAIALVISAYVDALFLGWCVARVYKTPGRALLPWSDIAKVGAAAMAAMLVIMSPSWTETLGFAGVVIGSAVFAGCYGLLLKLLAVHEAALLWGRFHRIYRRA